MAQVFGKSREGPYAIAWAHYWTVLNRQSKAAAVFAFQTPQLTSSTSQGGTSSTPPRASDVMDIDDNDIESSVASTQLSNALPIIENQ